MCQLLILTGLDPVKHRETEAFVKAAVEPLVNGNLDGFGYAAITHNGLVAERWLDVHQTFIQRKAVGAAVQQTVERLGNMAEYEKTYTRYGKINIKATFKGATSIIAHSRFATCDVTLKNVHPFIYNSTALIHNGVITNTRDLTNKISTCDSEGILHAYLDARMPTEPANMDLVVNALEGYYACGVFTQDKQDRWVLDIFRSDGAMLVGCRVPKLGPNAVAFATTPEILKHVAMKTKTPILGRCDVASGVFTRFNAITGATLFQSNFELYNDYYGYHGETASGHSPQDWFVNSQTTKINLGTTDEQNSHKEPSMKSMDTSGRDKFEPCSNKPLTLIPVSDYPNSKAISGQGPQSSTHKGIIDRIEDEVNVDKQFKKIVDTK